MSRGYRYEAGQQRSSFDGSLTSTIQGAVPALLGYGSQQEAKKVALHRGWGRTIPSLLFHFVPLGAAVGLIVLNTHEYYIGGELAGQVGMDKAKLDALQFAAKLLELMMQFCLTEIATSAIWSRLAAGRSVPFGAVFGDQRVAHISYLCSQEFRGAVSSTFFRASFLMTILSVCVVLASIVAPAGAIAMQPELMEWPAGGTSLWINATRDELWPSRLNSSGFSPSCRDPGGYAGGYCPSAQWQAMQSYFNVLSNLQNPNSVIPESIEFKGKHSTRRLNHRPRIGAYPFPWTIATLPQAVVADAITRVSALWYFAAFWAPGYRYKYRREATASIDAMVPVTHVYCAHISNSQPSPLFPALNKPKDGGEAYALEALPNSASTLWPSANGSGAQISWIELPPSFGNVSVGALVVIPSKSANGSSERMACSVDARWGGCTITSRRSAVMAADGQPPGIVDWDPKKGTPKFWDDFQPIKLTVDWAALLNPPLIGDANRTVFGMLTATAGIGDSSSLMDSNHIPTVEAVLAMMVTNGVAQTAYDRDLQGTVIGYDELVPGSWTPAAAETFMRGGDAFAVDPKQTPHWTKLQMSVTITGYAYHCHTRTKKVALFILISFSFVDFWYIIYQFLFRRQTSSAWKTVTGVVALAMNSRPTPALDNTCAGIKNLSTFALPVKVVSGGEDNDHLELAFGGPESGDGKWVVAGIEPGKRYGKLPGGNSGRSRGMHLRFHLALFLLAMRALNSHFSSRTSA
ncbi:MAG: hypothetical protein M1839_003249 [Geoglossum umbratile]|nr:MAG: hypothetical protein M1839_003249 [Geoglossum umbratile]